MKFNVSFVSSESPFSINADTQSATSSGTMTSTQDQLSTATATLLTFTPGAETQTPTGTALLTSQITQTPTSPVSGTLTRTPGPTSSNTPNFTNTPGPTETFRPLPSITLLFPIETATRTEEGISRDESTFERGETSDPNQGQTSRISARSILLIGTIFILWVVLAIFLIFFLRRLGE